MRRAINGVAVLVPVLLAIQPALADSVAVGSSSDGTVIVNGQPCRVVTRKDAGGNSTSVTSGANGLSGTTTVGPGGGAAVSISPGGSGSSAAVGSGSSSGGQAAAAAGSSCVIYRNEK
jgi:hypothetical protein